MTDLDSVRASIDVALNPPAPRGVGPARRAFRHALLRLSRAHARHQQGIDRALLALIGSLETRVADARARIERLEELPARTDRIADRVDEIVARNRALTEQTHALHERSGLLERHVGSLQGLAAEIRAVPDPRELGFEQFEDETAGSVIGYRQAKAPIAPDDTYVSFEDAFRQSEDVIRERQAPYVSLLARHAPVLDAGCGRGELLELLREKGVSAYGIDLDPGMVARARAKDLDVTQGDAVAHLEGLPDGSLGAVFAAQLVEHLPYEQLLTFLRAVRQKLEPGGMLIAETVNPHAPRALKNFWIDLTHQHPIFPEVLLTLCRGIGFTSAYVFHPGGTGNFDADQEHCGDYAIVAERGGEAEHQDAGAEAEHQDASAEAEREDAGGESAATAG